MKISEYQNEDALALIADLIEPTAEIFSDPKIRSILQGGGTRLEAIKIALKEHGKECVMILATLDGTTPDKYKGTVITMTKGLLDVFNDKELMDFFTSQGQMEEKKSATDAMENIKEKEK